MGKVTLKSESEVYRLSARQTEKYDKKYPHLAYEVRDVFGAKAYFASDVYSLGYIFKYLSIKISYQIIISKMMVEEPSHRVGVIYVVNTLRETVNKSVIILLIIINNITNISIT